MECALSGPAGAVSARRQSDPVVPGMLEPLEPRLLLSATFYPDLQNVVGPADDPTLPGAMDVFAPPVDSQTPPTDAPAFAEWTRMGGPGDVLALTGDQLSHFEFNDFGKDTRFTIFGQTAAGDAVIGDAEILRLDEYQAAIVLGSDLPAWSTYLIWAGSDAGYGYPAIVNQAEGWWVGPKVATRGETVSAYGRNLSHDNGTALSWVYLQPSSGSGQWVTPTAVNPYKVDFTVPVGLTNGDYEVWVHNGHGGTYGWDKAGTLTVDDGMPWTANVYNVKNYGAVGDGATDDRAAIIAAYTAAKNAGDWNTVYFPTGTYAISSNIQVQAKQRWVGDGMDLTTIVSHSSWGTTGSSSLLGGSSNNEVKDLALQASPEYTYPFLVHRRGVTNTHYTNVRFSAQGYQIFDGHSSYRVLFTGCEFIGKQSFLGNASQVFFDGCDFYATNDSPSMLFTWGGDDISLANSTCRDLDNSDPNSGAGWGQGRFFTGNGIWGTGINTYIGDNETIDMAVRPGVGDQNTGEQLMWEGNNYKYYGSPTAATATTVTFAEVWDLTGRYLTVTDGKGLGQFRLITGYDSGTKTFTVATPFNVIPDSTSTINIGDVNANVAIYNNTLDGKAANVSTSTHNASAGIEPFGGAINWVVADNTLTDLRTGFAIFGLSNGDPEGVQPCYWGLYSNNSMTNVRTGIYTTTSTIEIGDPGSAMLGNVFRDNTVNGALDSGIIHGGGSAPPDSSSLNVFDDNTITNVPVGIDCGGVVKNAVLYRNDFTRGDKTYSGSKGIDFNANQTPALRENTWTGFETTYAGATPGAILEAPYRVLEAAAASGTTDQVTLTVWNAGTSSLAWSVTEDVDWLTCSPASGSVPGEGGFADVTVTCTAKQYLAPGVHSGAITVAAGGQVQRVMVYFTVTGTSGPEPTSAEVTLSATDPSAAESGPNSGTFTFTRSNTTGELRVHYSVAGTAVDADYDGTLFGIVVFAPGQSTAALTITPNDDDLIENAETVQLTILADEDYTIGSPSSGTVTIASEDLPEVNIVATDSQAAEQGPDPGQFAITRSGTGLLTHGALTVHYTLGGTAEAEDYVETFGGVAVIPDGQTSVLLTVTPVDDAVLNEGAETVALTLLTDPAYTVGEPDSDLISIAENDQVAAFYDITDGFYANRPTVVGATTQIGVDNWWYYKSLWVGGNKGDSFTANPNGFVVMTEGKTNPYGWWVPPNRPYMYNGTVSGTGHATILSGSAQGGGVYVDAANTTMLAFEWRAPVECVVDVSFEFIGRNDYSSDLEFHLGYWEGTTWTKIGSPSWVKVTRDHVVGSEAALSATGIHMDAGDSIVLCVNCYDEDAYDGGLIMGGIDFDPVEVLPEVVLTATDDQAAESPLDTGTFQVTRDTTAGDLTVHYTIGGTADNTDDYATLSGSVVIPDGQTSATITITPVDDLDPEGAETVVLTLAADPAYVIASPSTGTVTIADDDLVVTTVSLSAPDPDADESGADTGTFQVTRDVTAGELTVHYTIGGTAANTDDYATLSGSVVLPNGQASATIVVTPVDDSDVELDETVILTLSSDPWYTVGAPSQATVTIADSDRVEDLVAYWAFDETGGTTAHDTSGHGSVNDAALMNDAAFTAAGRYGGAVVFDGSNDYVDVPDTTDINLAPYAARTISLWFNVDDETVSSRKQVLYEEGGGGRGLNLYLYDGSLYVGGWNVEGWEAGTYLSVSIAGYAGGWHHAALVLDASGPVLDPDVLRGYLDGSPVGSGQGRSLATHGDDIGIGRTDGYTKFHTGDSGTDGDGFAGKIDEVRVYNLALSDAEIAALAAPAPTVALTSPTEGAIVRTDVGATIAAQVSDAEGLVRVEFYAGTDKVGDDTAAPYETLWMPGQTGSVALTAKAVYTGLAVDSAPVNVTAAYPADADFDDDVDLDDLTILGTFYNIPGTYNWSQGDVDQDGDVDLDDLTILGTYYNTSWSPPPGTLATGEGTASPSVAPQQEPALPVEGAGPEQLRGPVKSVLDHEPGVASQADAGNARSEATPAGPDLLARLWAAPRHGLAAEPTHLPAAASPSLRPAEHQTGPAIPEQELVDVLSSSPLLGVLATPSR